MGVTSENSMTSRKNKRPNNTLTAEEHELLRSRPREALARLEGDNFTREDWYYVAFRAQVGMNVAAQFYEETTKQQMREALNHVLRIAVDNIDTLIFKPSPEQLEWCHAALDATDEMTKDLTRSVYSHVMLPVGKQICAYMETVDIKLEDISVKKETT